MIKNDKELELTKNMIFKFNERLLLLNNIGKSIETVKFERHAIQALLKNLSKQVELYMKIIGKEISFTNVTSCKDICTAVIGKRIQLEIDEQAMAEALGITVEEYNFLEFNEFYGIDKEMLSSIFSLLKLSNEISVFNSDEALLKIVEHNLKKLNFPQSILSHILPVSFTNVKDAFAKHSSDANCLFDNFLEAFKCFFRINLTESISNDVIDKTFAVAFKRRVNTNDDQLDFISAFAAHCALIIANQLSTNSSVMRADPIVIRQAIISQYGKLSFESCLDYIWGLNIGVLPLNITRGFHGACFDFDNKKIIALNQQNRLVSRWKFDLLHELYHALTMDYNVYLERSDIMEQNDDEESNASLFASHVIFGCEMDSYIKIVLENSNGKIEQIKNNIERVSVKYNLNIDDFSNYFAFKTRNQTTNFWGIVANLQQDKRSPNEISKSVLLQKLNFEFISDDDIYLLQKILSDEVKI